ncbi:MAG: TIGR04283 family arsenosugar biosynthesis glycosyltransferase [Pseudomonadota bacterium]
MSGRAPISIVVPTLDAVAAIGPCLGRLGEGLMSGLVRELVIADGGSQDAIADVAEAVGATLVTTPPGRGTQLAAGVAATSGPWVLVVHADTLLPEDWPTLLARHLATHPDAAGYFGLAFDDRSVAARLVAGWAILRSSLFALPYGDQALLVPRALYDRAGGYPEIPLMEDVALVSAITRTAGRGALQRLPGTVTTSAARYRRDGWIRRGVRNLTILARWRLGADPADLARAYRVEGQRGAG